MDRASVGSMATWTGGYLFGAVLIQQETRRTPPTGVSLRHIAAPGPAGSPAGGGVLTCAAGFGPGGQKEELPQPGGSWDMNRTNENDLLPQ